MPSLKRCVAIPVLCALLVACSPIKPEEEASGVHEQPGVTMIPGGPMEPTPAPTPKIPASQQEAQDTVLRYLQQTVNALPPGSTLDGTRYITGGDTRYCEDDPSGPDAPVKFSDWRDIQTPGQSSEFNALVAEVGRLWESWGWQVIERDGYEKPNRFGYAPDGYVLQINASYPANYPPGVIGASPCYPGNLRRDDIPRNPPVITQEAR